MEFLLVGESKIKIVLSKDECMDFGFDRSVPDVSGNGARRSFWKILDRAKSEVGFDPAGDKVLIQLYPVKAGGLEMFVTKLGILPDASARLVSRSDRIAMLSKKKSIYVFYSFESVILAARAVAAICEGDLPISDVYVNGDTYFLVIEEYRKGGEPSEFPCIMEFGSGLAAESYTYICEHSKCLTEGDGIEKFSVL